MRICLRRDMRAARAFMPAAVLCTAQDAHLAETLVVSPVLLRPSLAVLTVAACRVFEREGVQVVCDTVSMDFLKGAVIEFEDSLMRSAFQVSSSASDTDGV